MIFLGDTVFHYSVWLQQFLIRLLELKPNKLPMIVTTYSPIAQNLMFSGSGLLPRIKYVVNNLVNGTLRSVYIVCQ